MSLTHPVSPLSQRLSLQSLFNAMNEAMAIHEIILDDQGRPCNYRYLEVNRAFEEMTGLKREAVLGRTVLELIPDLEPYWIETFGQVALTGQSARFENYAAAMNKHFQVSAYSPTKGQFVALFYDITDRKQMELEAARLAAAIGPNPRMTAAGRAKAKPLTTSELARELQKSQALYEISQMLAGTVDLKKTLQQIADSAWRLIKTSNRTILHLMDSSKQRLQPVALAGEDLPQGPILPLNFKPGVGIAGLVISTGEAINVTDVLNDSRYLPVQRQTGYLPSFRALLVVPVKSVSEDHRASIIIGTLSVQSPVPGAFSEDDTRLLSALGAQAAVAIEKARLYNDLQTALEQEKSARAQLVQAEKLAALGRIVASVAHELNNPLQAMQNALYLIQLEGNLSPQAKEDLQTVLGETERMAGLIARLRETYRPASSEEFQPTSINQLVEDVRLLLATHLRRSRITCEFHPDETIPPIPLIRDQIKQVMINICLNAVEAMRDGGQISISTRLMPEGQGVKLSISDNGPSIDPKLLPIIFDPFVTTKAGEGGTGLGLAITYDIVQRHLGRIEVESQPGRGSTFHVWLPLEPRMPAASKSPRLGWE